MTGFQGRPASVLVRAPAKVNLDLRILGRRRDGYHELRTILQSIALHDTLTFTQCPGPMTVRSRLRTVPRDDANLVWKAANALWISVGRRGTPRGVAISITKRIPMGGGLGGGSSDVAGALRALCALWNVAPSARRMKALGAQVGSDVPFFFDGGMALGTGRGERLRRLSDLDPCWVLLAIPQCGVSTAAAYQWFDAARSGRATPLPRAWRSRLGLLRNDLADVVMARHPALAVMLERLHATRAALVAMTGSGSTVFALYREHSLAVAARRRVRSRGWHTVLTRTLTRDEFGRFTAVTRRS